MTWENENLIGREDYKFRYCKIDQKQIYRLEIKFIHSLGGIPMTLKLEEEPRKNQVFNNKYNHLRIVVNFFI